MISSDISFLPLKNLRLKFTNYLSVYNAQKMNFSITNFFSKCDQIRRNLIWSHLLKKSVMENFIFCAVYNS